MSQAAILAEIAAMRAEMATGFAAMVTKAEMTVGFAGLRSDLAAFRGKISAAVTRICEATESMGDQLDDVRRLFEPGVP